MEFQRWSCHGWCPVYWIWVFPDGRVFYHGDSHVKIRGYFEWWVSEQKVAQLREAFEQAQFWGFAEAYERVGRTCAASVDITYASAGRGEHHVRHYHGNDDAPEALYRLEEEIDRIMEIEKWIGTLEERTQAEADRWH